MRLNVLKPMRIWPNTTTLIEWARDMTRLPDAMRKMPIRYIFLLPRCSSVSTKKRLPAIALMKLKERSIPKIYSF